MIFLRYKDLQELLILQKFYFIIESLIGKMCHLKIEMVN